MLDVAAHVVRSDLSRFAALSKLWMLAFGVRGTFAVRSQHCRKSVGGSDESNAKHCLLENQARGKAGVVVGRIPFHFVVLGATYR